MDWIYGKHVLSGTDFTARIYSCHGPLTTFIIKIKTVDTLMRKGLGHTAVSTIEVSSVTLHNSTKPFITIRHKMGIWTFWYKLHIFIYFMVRRFFTSTHNLCFGAKTRKIGIPLHTPLLLYKSGVYVRGYSFS